MTISIYPIPLSLFWMLKTEKRKGVLCFGEFGQKINCFCNENAKSPKTCAKVEILLTATLNHRLATITNILPSDLMESISYQQWRPTIEICLYAFDN